MKDVWEMTKLELSKYVPGVLEKSGDINSWTEKEYLGCMIDKWVKVKPGLYATRNKRFTARKMMKGMWTLTDGIDKWVGYAETLAWIKGLANRVVLEEFTQRKMIVLENQEAKP